MNSIHADETRRLKFLQDAFHFTVKMSWTQWSAGKNKSRAHFRKWSADIDSDSDWALLSFKPCDEIKRKHRSRVSACCMNRRQIKSDKETNRMEWSETHSSMFSVNSNFKQHQCILVEKVLNTGGGVQVEAVFQLYGFVYRFIHIRKYLCLYVYVYIFTQIYTDIYHRHIYSIYT